MPMWSVINWWHSVATDRLWKYRSVGAVEHHDQNVLDQVKQDCSRWKLAEFHRSVLTNIWYRAQMISWCCATNDYLWSSTGPTFLSFHWSLILSNSSMKPLLAKIISTVAAKSFGRFKPTAMKSRLLPSATKCYTKLLISVLRSG